MLFEKLQLEPEEKILKVVRKHWLVIVSELFGVFLTAILPLVVLGVFQTGVSTLNITVPEVTHSGSMITFATTVWFLFSTMAGFMIWTHYYLDLWIITDRRIIAVDQIHFFNRNVAIFRLERLQDIEFSIKGLIQTFFNFGTLSAQTAGHNEANFSSTNLPHPDELQNLIQKAMDARLSTLNNKPNLTGE
jgi:hypothetical protein